jgi:lysosomal acid lipase/cholesteryl ester hydrolase
MFPKREEKIREKKAKRNFAEENGYILEAHEITTEDGYILTLLRVSKKPESIIEVQNKEVKSSVKKPVVLMVHGLFCKGTDWCFTPPDKGLRK